MAPDCIYRTGMPHSIRMPLQSLDLQRVILEYPLLAQLVAALRIAVICEAARQSPKLSSHIRHPDSCPSSSCDRFLDFHVELYQENFCKMRAGLDRTLPEEHLVKWVSLEKKT